MLLFNRMKSEGMSVELEDSRLWKVCKIFRDGWKNQIKYYKCFSSGTEILHSFLSDLIFEDACSSIESIGFQFAVDVVMEMGSIFKKQCNYLRSALAAARSKCIIFLFAYWDVSDCFY